jgi:hypothetical protein
MRRLQTALTDGCIMTPIESPNLPKRGIALAAVSVGAEKAKEYLESRGIAVFDIMPSSAITDGTAAHADLHLLHLDGQKHYSAYHHSYAVEGQSSDYFYALALSHKRQTPYNGGKNEEYAAFKLSFFRCYHSTEFFRNMIAQRRVIKFGFWNKI